jgi:hypothetical protein
MALKAYAITTGAAIPAYRQWINPEVNRITEDNSRTATKDIPE